ncbi:MAG: DMT family transporter, partial [Deltaproteobacteria bacterium]|nr:DMT family transporter [Deltaproteobacteria bacterium]
RGFSPAADTNIVSLLGLVSAVFAALAYICVRRLSATDSVETIVFYFTGISTLLSLPALFIDFALPDANGWIGLAGVGVFATLGQLFLTSAYRYERASIVSSFSYMTPLFSFFLGIALFDEIPRTASIIGSLMIILSGVAIAVLTRTGADQ